MGGFILERPTPFLSFLTEWRGRPVYLETMHHICNNGDKLIQMGMAHVLRQAGVLRVDSPEDAQLVVINGSGGMNDVSPGGLRVLERYRREMSFKPVAVGPSTLRFQGIDIERLFGDGASPVWLFARDPLSARLAVGAGVPGHVEVRTSPDLAFEVVHTDWFKAVAAGVAERHVLIAIRKDSEGTTAGLLARTHGKWLPRRVRKPLSKLRDRLVALRSGDVLSQVLREERIPRGAPRIYRDISVSVGWDEFVQTIQRARLVVTDRLHVGVLAHLLGKRLIYRPGVYHKVPMVYQFNMSYPGSRTTLLD